MASSSWTTALQRVFGVLSVAVVGGLPASGQAANLAGVFSAGNVRYEFIICSTCDRPSDDLFNGSAGGLGSHGPAIVDGAGFRGGGTGEVYARSMLVGPNALPALDAAAGVFPGFGAHDGFSDPGFYYFSATASAGAVQWFSYHGALPQTYSFRYTLMGNAVNLALPLTPEGDLPLSGSGGLAIHNGLNPDLELPYGQIVDVHQQSFAPDSSPFLEHGTVAIDVDPGATFYLLGFAAANAGMGGHGLVNTKLSVEMLLGDPSMLVPALPPVPEPATFWLLAAGLACLLLRRCKA